MDLPPQTAAQSRASSLSYLFVFAFIIFMLSDPNSSSSSSSSGLVDQEMKEVYGRALGRARMERWVIGNATQGQWNETEIQADPEEILQDVRKLLSPFGNGQGGTYFYNHTGIGRGQWESIPLTTVDISRFNLSIPIYGQMPEKPDNSTDQPVRPPILSDIPLEDRLRLNRGTLFNWLGRGEIRLTLTQSDSNPSHYENGTVEGATFDQAAALGLSLEDDRTGKQVSLDLQGVHLGETAQAWALAYPSNRHLPLPEIMGLVKAEKTGKVERVGQVLVNELDRRIEEYTKVVEGAEVGNYGSEDSPSFNCSFHLYLQGHPEPASRLPLALYEADAKADTGLSSSSRITPKLSLAAFSPDCALLLHVDQLAITTVERTYKKCINYAFGLTIVVICQCLLIIRQMKKSQTPSALSRVSYWTIASQALLDGYSCLIHLTVGIVAIEIFLPFTAAAFITFILVSVFQMRFLITIWRIQAPERLTAARERREARNRARIQAEQAAAVTTDQSLTPPSGAAAVDAPAEQRPESEATFSGQYIRFYILLGIGAVIFVQTQSLPRWLSQPLVALFLLVAHSFWIPQIIRNVKRGSRRALDPAYLIGMSALRLYLPLYAYACPDNILDQRPQPWIWLVVLWLMAQVLLILLQDTLGPRFFISERYMPKPYEYHPFLQSSDEENPASLLGDCTICMTPLIDKEPRRELDTTSAAAGARRTASAILGKNLELMQAPCGHTYHTVCLQQWMGVRLQCPLCKAPLPPNN